MGRVSRQKFVFIFHRSWVVVPEVGTVRTLCAAECLIMVFFFFFFSFKVQGVWWKVRIPKCCDTSTYNQVQTGS